MRDFLLDRARSIKNEEEKRLFISLISEVLLPLCEHEDLKFAALEDRVFNELPRDTSRFYVQSTVIDRSDLDASLTGLWPVSHADSKEYRPSGEEIMRLAAAGELVVERIFAPVAHSEFMRIANSKTRFRGMLRTNKNIYPVVCELRKSSHYLDIVENLYTVFVANGVPWQTVNVSYLNKFFDLVVVSIDAETLADKEVMDCVEVSFGDLDDSLKRKHLPVWNISHITAKNDDFAVPAGDNINYEFKFDTQKYGGDNGYLVDAAKANLVSVRVEPGCIVAVSPSSRNIEIDILMFSQEITHSFDYLKYPALSNIQTDSFVGRISAGSNITPRVKSELMRMLHQYTWPDGLQLAWIKYSDGDVKNEVYDMNWFLIDELHAYTPTRTMIIQFHLAGNQEFYMKDYASFLVSQVQLLFPDYSCVGVFV